MTNLNVLAHAGESHESELTGLAHYVAPWYFAVPAFLIGLALIGYLTWLVSGRQQDKVMIVLALVCLISGFTLFNISALVSVVAILGGLGLSVLLTFGGLTAGSHKKKSDS